ncbi:hypothetical protein [Sphingopyxis sp. 22461]|uniref:hypothetical protein n=1 Tax=Sphingopyxis sp. 22461 TaxID=3453923 RepID=UPI003F85042F
MGDGSNILSTQPLPTFQRVGPAPAADELTALREKVAGLKGALQNIADGWPFPVAEARRALLDLQGGEDAH